MKLFFKDKAPLIFLYLLNMIFLVVIYQYVGGFKESGNLYYFIFISVFLLICFLIYDYFRSNSFYKKLSKIPEDLEDSIMSAGTTEIAQALNNLMKSQYKLYQEQIQEYDRKQREHITFINQWVHQMKTPVSVIQLITQENEYEPHMKNIQEEVERINTGLNMALYMARLDAFEYDFHIETIDLNSIVFKVVNEFKRLFIRKGLLPVVQIEEGIFIQSDEKWLVFILQQFLTNAIRYSAERNKKITIMAYKQNKDIILEVKDQGVGIPKNDIKRVFEAFYTGENGRRFGESTGMGLYLVKQVCDKLQHMVEIESEVGMGTTVKIKF